MRVRVAKPTTPPPTPPAEEPAGCQHPTYRPDTPNHWAEFFCDTCHEQLSKAELSGRQNLGYKFP